MVQIEFKKFEHPIFAIMLSKEERKELNTRFWTGFMKQMDNYRSADGRKINWVTYRTHVKDLYFRMEVDFDGARVCIDIQHRDEGIRELFTEQFIEMRKIMQNEVGSEASFDTSAVSVAGLPITRICFSDDTKKISRPGDWAAIYDFLEDHIRGLDRFWVDVRDVFIELSR